MLFRTGPLHRHIGLHIDHREPGEGEQPLPQQTKRDVPDFLRNQERLSCPNTTDAVDGLSSAVNRPESRVQQSCLASSAMCTIVSGIRALWRQKYPPASGPCQARMLTCFAPGLVEQREPLPVLLAARHGQRIFRREPDRFCLNLIPYTPEMPQRPGICWMPGRFFTGVPFMPPVLTPRPARRHSPPRRYGLSPRFPRCR